ncbi:Protein METABOLIC NETWORK MODULATOR 1 [Cardamine amara subsp. amara]|uniref:Protein METABOLIC NETWORK MODULATOR 1 n=1 Tax=Cardamine amara subsp. amara TaxID=228776 RepID=A0ABD1A4P6_CARAN
MNQNTRKSPPPPATDLLGKRKRVSPGKSETPTPKQEMNLVGRRISGVVEGTFDEGYLINVKVNDIGMKLRGLVFKPGKVSPITSENDMAPLVRMYEREEIKKNQTDTSLPNDQSTEDAVTTDLEMLDSGRALVLVPHESNGEFTVQAEEDMIEKDGDIEGATLLMEFYEFHNAT